MSQTLSLQPGKYALFIVPPVAGVDYTGTPLPTVSYQWKKNGTAISGQTSATISGVWVEQTGGTVDLVDGDVISIDIILTNVVDVSTKTISATLDSAIPAPVISPVSIRQLSGSTYQTVTSLANTDIGEQVIVASNTGGTVTTTPPVLTTYQWRRGFAPIAGATNQTYTLQAADADSIIDCVVTATNSGGTTTATATAVVGTVADAGWTALTPSADSRLVYVSNGGNDAAAAAVYGRGYYLPSDSEIGADPTQPVGAVVAYATIEAAKSVLRDGSGTSLAGEPEWLLLRRGDTFTLAADLMTNRTAGRSNSERRVYAAYGPIVQPRPRVLVPPGVHLVNSWTGGGNYAMVSIEAYRLPDLRGLNVGKFEVMYGSANILIEDCNFVVGGNGDANNKPDNIVMRRCVQSGQFSGESHSAGVYLVAYGSVTIEECVFDMNGYKEDPFDPSTWTAGPISGLVAGELPAGTGVQPTRTWFDRNCYLESYGSMRFRGNISSRSGGGSSVQMRVGGIAERNLFLFNNSALGTGHPEADRDFIQDSLIVSNLVLHDDHMRPPGGYGGGLRTAAGAGGIGILSDNIVAHFHRDNNSDAALAGGGYKPSGSRLPLQAQQITISDNVALLRQHTIAIDLQKQTVPYANGVSGVLNANISGNAIAVSELGPSPTLASKATVSGDGARPAEHVWGTPQSPNHYFAPRDPSNSSYNTGVHFFWQGGTSTPSGGDPTLQYNSNLGGTFTRWQQQGYDLDSTLHPTIEGLAAAMGWIAPERDIVSYMQSIDPAFVPNEDVTTDDGVPAAKRRTDAQKVREVMQSTGMSDAQARLTARRYHASLVFIERAKANRRGAWDTRWTAEAVNNYIRAGFGKAPVAGAYDTRSLATRLAEYAT